MELTFFLKGVLIGFAMAVPLGPIGIICINKTITEGWLRGLIVGFGAATADLLFSCVAAFGITIISNIIDTQRIWIRLVGGAVLFFLGIKTFRALPANPDIPINSNGILSSYLTTVFLTLTNPFTVFVFIGVFAALGLGNGLDVFSASTLVAGVFIGSSLWFLFLSSGVTLFRNRFKLNGLRWVNKIAGILIILSGIIAVVSLL